MARVGKIKRKDAGVRMLVSRQDYHPGANWLGLLINAAGRKVIGFITHKSILLYFSGRLCI